MARALGLWESLVTNYVGLGRSVRIYWPLPRDLDEVAPEQRLFGPQYASRLGYGSQDQALRRERLMTRPMLTSPMLISATVSGSGTETTAYTP